MKSPATKSGNGHEAALATSLRAIKAVVFDFDGVFTDNCVIVSDDGHESVTCWRSDGLGLSRVRALGVEMAIMSTETNPVVSKRAAKLKLRCIQGIENKGACLRAFAEEKGLSPEQLAFVGNDINDIECLRFAGLSVVVLDAAEEILPYAKLHLSKPGGRGAVREFCDMLWRAKSGAR